MALNNDYGMDTEFVEALKPHYTPGSSVMPSTTTPTQRPSSSMADAVEIQNLKDQVQDYTEKLDVVKTRLKEKSHDIDMMKLQLDQAAEFKIKIMESHSALKKELEKVKMEKQDALEEKYEFNKIAHETAILEKKIASLDKENATLDKEIAEIKAETLQIELDQAKERIEELTVENTKQCNYLHKSNERLTVRIEELASQVNDLLEQVDAALGAEE